MYEFSIEIYYQNYTENWEKVDLRKYHFQFKFNPNSYFNSHFVQAVVYCVVIICNFYSTFEGWCDQYVIVTP